MVLQLRSIKSYIGASKARLSCSLAERSCQRLACGRSRETRFERSGTALNIVQEYHVASRVPRQARRGSETAPRWPLCSSNSSKFLPLTMKCLTHAWGAGKNKRKEMLHKESRRVAAHALEPQFEKESCVIECRKSTM
jgi:hypothetical protein